MSIVILLFISCAVFAQKKKHEVREFHPFERPHTKEIRTLNDTLIPDLVNKVESYTYKIDRNNFLLSRNFDLTPIRNALPDIEKRLDGFKLRFEQLGQNMNLRGLNSATILLGETSKKLSDYKATLTDYSVQLTNSGEIVRKILSDSALNQLVSDSVLNDQIHDVISEGRDLDTLQKLTLAKVNLLRSRVSVSLFQANDIVSDMVYLTISKKINMWSQEESPLLNAKENQYPLSFEQAIGKGLQTSYKIVAIYTSGKSSFLIAGLLLFFFIQLWCRSNIRRVKKTEDADSVFGQMNFLKRSVFVSNLMAFFTYAPLFFPNPTMPFLHVFELLRLASLCFLIFPFLTRQSKILWSLLSLLWAFYAIDDILLNTAFGERWWLLIAGVLLAFVCLKIIFSKNKIFTKIEESPATKVIVIFTLVQVVLSIAFNLTGRLSLAKIFGVSAIQCLMLGITLKVFCTIVLEQIYLQTEAYSGSRFSAFINFKELQSRIRRYLWVLASLVWVIAFIRDLTLYDWMLKITSAFFNQPRSIGSYKFDYASVAIFILIIWISAMVSRFIRFFFGYEKSVVTGKRSSLNSVILLIRLAIWTVGFLIAVAAAGIPLDRVSIMIGALGVGIGFGLQTIVNNLVSGVIIAFERPIQVGDQIEIGGKTGTVKEIGVRASKIHNSEGADIIIPNGDLLSQHLINWTMQGRSKRVEFTIGVPYSTNLDVARNLIDEKLKENTNILQTPEPVIIVQDFSDYAINIRILLWVPDLASAGNVRTSAMIDIKNTLSAAGIQLQIRPIG
ncbi:MAG: mechanosensitive ion channel domain-containing protein [Ginsengibacter sp.]